MTSCFRLLAILVFGLGFVITAAAQSPSQSAAAVTATVTARLRCLAVNVPLTGLFMPDREGKPQAIAIPANYLAGPYDYSGPAALTFSRRSTPAERAAFLASAKPGSTAKPPEFVPVVSVALPVNGGDLLVLFDSLDGATCRAGVLDYSAATVPSGTYSVWGLAPRALGLQLGETRNVIEPGRRQLIRLSSSEDTYVDLAVFGVDASGQSRRLAGGRHRHRPDVRQLLFLVASPTGDRVTVRVITDVTPAATATAR